MINLTLIGCSKQWRAPDTERGPGCRVCCTAVSVELTTAQVATCPIRTLGIPCLALADVLVVTISRVAVAC